MHMTCCSPKETSLILFLDRPMQFKANEQLQKFLKYLRLEVPLRSSPRHIYSHNLILASPPFFPFPFPFSKGVFEVSHLGGPYSKYKQFSLYRDAEPHLYYLSSQVRDLVLCFGFFPEKMFLLGNEMNFSSFFKWLPIYVHNQTNHKAYLKRKLAHRYFIMHKCIIWIT